MILVKHILSKFESINAVFNKDSKYGLDFLIGPLYKKIKFVYQH